MCRIAKADFGGGTAAPSAARAWMTDLLDRWEVPWLSETASLLTNELVTNAIRHAKSGPVITAAIANGSLEVGVTDGKPDQVPQVFSTEDLTRDGGRGMAIVEALSTDWGMTIYPKVKHVTATIWTKWFSTRGAKSSRTRGHGTMPVASCPLRSSLVRHGPGMKMAATPRQDHRGNEGDLVSVKPDRVHDDLASICARRQSSTTRCRWLSVWQLIR